jgi:hypothetical protein
MMMARALARSQLVCWAPTTRTPKARAGSRPPAPAPAAGARARRPRARGRAPPRTAPTACIRTRRRRRRRWGCGVGRSPWLRRCGPGQQRSPPPARPAPDAEPARPPSPAARAAAQRLGRCPGRCPLPCLSVPQAPTRTAAELPPPDRRRRRRQRTHARAATTPVSTARSRCSCSARCCRCQPRRGGYASHQPQLRVRGMWSSPAGASKRAAWLSVSLCCCLPALREPAQRRQRKVESAQRQRHTRLALPEPTRQPPPSLPHRPPTHARRKPMPGAAALPQCCSQLGWRPHPVKQAPAAPQRTCVVWPRVHPSPGDSGEQPRSC